MRTNTYYAATAALIFAVSGAANARAPLAATMGRGNAAIQADGDETRKTPEWSMPHLFSAGLVTPGIKVMGGFTYASYQVRSFEAKGQQVTVSPTDWIEAYYGRQFILAKGHSSTSRFYATNDFFGFRAVVKKPTLEDSSAWSIQYQTNQASDAVISTSSGSSSSEESLYGPHTNSFGVNYQDKNDWQYQILYSVVLPPHLLQAHSYTLGVAKDFDLGSGVEARLQGQLVAQSFLGAVHKSNYELKSIFNAAVAYNPTPWLTLEADATLLPSGMPFDCGNFTGVSSFALYEPSSIVNDLREKFLAFGSLNILAHWRF